MIRALFKWSTAVLVVAALTVLPGCGGSKAEKGPPGQSGHYEGDGHDHSKHKAGHHDGDGHDHSKGGGEHNDHEGEGEHK